MVPLARLSLLALASVAAGAPRAEPQCKDKLQNDTGIGGGGTVTALANVNSLGACCALCHGNYHDECSGWVYGPTGAPDADDGASTTGLATHNCAIMATNGPAKHVANHVTGINADAPPPPPPPSPGAPCNADVNCIAARIGAKHWRCKGPAKVAAGTDSNCHIPGPGTKGNSTCACTVQACKAGPAAPSNVSATAQYLVIGDSISLGMNSDLSALVAADGWELTHNPGNAASSNLGEHCIGDGQTGWVQAAARKYDVISFQFGLHDLGFDTERISLAQYTALMTKLTASLAAVQKQHGTKLLWVKTTPVPTVPQYGRDGCNDTKKCLNPPRFDADVVLYNKAADGVMAEANAAGAKIATADLYSFVLAKCGGAGYSNCSGFQLPMNVHYTAAGWTALAAEMHKLLQKL